MAKVFAAAWLLVLVAGGSASAQHFDNPENLAFSNGTLFAENYYGNDVTAFSPAGTYLGSFAVAEHPDRMAAGKSGQLWIGNEVISASFTFVYNFKGTALHEYNLDDISLAVDARNNDWVSVPVSTTNGIEVLTVKGAVLQHYTVDQQGLALVGGAVAISGNTLWYASQGGQIASYNLTEFENGTASEQARFADGIGGIPVQVAIDSAGDIYIVDGASTMDKYSPTGTLLLQVTGLSGCHGVAVDPSGNIYLDSADSVEVYNAAGVLIRTIL